jgi:CRP-like cAMP-binding protein
MTTNDLLRTENRLLGLVPPAGRELLAPLERVALVVGQELESPNQPIEYVYFVESGLLSILAVGATQKAAKKIEVGMIGYEGMTATAALASDRAAHSMLVQSPGLALRLPIAPFRATLAVPELRSLWLRYAHVLMVQATHTALANGQGTLVERLARWIVMWHDRIRQPEIKVTHTYVSSLLGVRRAGVTVAMHHLEGEHLIRSHRNLITVMDRDGLIGRANGYYGQPEAEYERLFR